MHRTVEREVEHLAEMESKRCTACGKGDKDAVLKTCVACKLARYCSVECQKAHWPKHKKECKRRAAELFDEALFKQPPTKEDCPICFVQLPPKSSYHECCGKNICCGCEYAHNVAHDNAKYDYPPCPFCRTPRYTSIEEHIKRLQKRVGAGDAVAMYILGMLYQKGGRGLSQDYGKTMDLWLKAGKLGLGNAYQNLSSSYQTGLGTKIDAKKARYYCELGAMAGDKNSRYNLGCDEGNSGNMRRAYRHWMIAARAGESESVRLVREGYSDGYVTKNEFENTLRGYKEYLDDIKTEQREIAGRENVSWDDF